MLFVNIGLVKIKLWENKDKEIEDNTDYSIIVMMSALLTLTFDLI